MKFDPITFLEIKGVPEQKLEELRTVVYIDMARYLLERFIEELPDSDKLVVERRAKRLKRPEAVLAMVTDFLPDYEQKKIGWLKQYKQEVNLDKFRRLYE